VDDRVETAREVALIAAARDEMELANAIILAVPVPEKSEMPNDVVEAMLAEALRLAVSKGIKGKDVTPFLLSDLSERSKGKTLAANIALLENNARVAAEVAQTIT
jgi:pseudouridine-5'-phosphate glycosidase